MATIIGNPYSIGTSIGQSIADVGKSMFGDTLTPALKRGELAYTGAKTEGVNFTNRSNAALQDLIANTPNGIEGLTNNPVAQSFLVGTNNFTPQKMAELNRLAASTNTANPITGGTNPISRAILGAGGSMASTPMGFEQADQTNRRGQDLTFSASRLNNRDIIGQKMYEFQNKPYEAMQGANPVIVPQGQAASGDYQPYVKPTQGMTTTLPDGTVISMGGSGRETDMTRKADLIGSAMIPGMERLRDAFVRGESVSPTSTAVTSLLPTNSFVTNTAQALGAINKTDQEIIASLDSALTYMYQLTGAARTESEDHRARANVPLPTDSPQTRRIKAGVLYNIARGIANQARDPRVKDELIASIDGMFSPIFNGGSGQPTQPPSAPPMAGQAPVAAAPTRLRYNPATGGLE